MNDTVSTCAGECGRLSTCRVRSTSSGSVAEDSRFLKKYLCFTLAFLHICLFAHTLNQPLKRKLTYSFTHLSIPVHMNSDHRSKLSWRYFFCSSSIAFPWPFTCAAPCTGTTPPAHPSCVCATHVTSTPVARRSTIACLVYWSGRPLTHWLVKVTLVCGCIRVGIQRGESSLR